MDQSWCGGWIPFPRLRRAGDDNGEVRPLGCPFRSPVVIPGRSAAEGKGIHAVTLESGSASRARRAGEDNGQPGQCSHFVLDGHVKLGYIVSVRFTEGRAHEAS